MRRRMRERVTVGRGGFVEQPLHLELGAEIDVRVDVAGRQARRLAVALDGTWQIALGGERVAEVVVRWRIGRVARQRRLNQRRGGAGAAALVSDDAGEMQRADVV